MYHGSKDSKGSLPVNPPIYFRLLFTGWRSDFCLSVMIQVTIILYIDKRHNKNANLQTAPELKSLDLSQLPSSATCETNYDSFIALFLCSTMIALRPQNYTENKMESADWFRGGQMLFPLQVFGAPPQKRRNPTLHFSHNHVIPSNDLSLALHTKSCLQCFSARHRCFKKSRLSHA